MGTLLISEMKKKASSFLQEKYKTARLAFTDVTQAEMLAEEATNNDPWGPDAKTMTKIAEASFDIDDYWRIVDVIHMRLYSDWKEWRQSYKALVLLDFLLTHGPEDFAEEFQCDSSVIEDLGTFKHIDETGFNWGVSMQKKSERILKLLTGGPILKEARLKALKITKDIQGFGNLMGSPSSSSSTSATSRTSSFGSYSTNSSTWNETDELNKYEKRQPNKDPIENYALGGLPEEKHATFQAINKNIAGLHLWDSPIQETGSLLDPEEDEENINGLSSGFFSRFGGVSCTSKHDSGKVKFRSLSDAGKAIKKKIDRQFSTRY